MVVDALYALVNFNFLFGCPFFVGGGDEKVAKQVKIAYSIIKSGKTLRRSKEIYYLRKM